MAIHAMPMHSGIAPVVGGTINQAPLFSILNTLATSTSPAPSPCTSSVSISSSVTASVETPVVLSTSSIVPSSTITADPTVVVDVDKLLPTSTCSGLSLTTKVSDSSDVEMQQRTARRLFAGFIAAALSYITISGVVVHYTKDSPITKYWEEDGEWVATSRSWIDRQVCRWFGMCGTMHLNSRGWTWPHTENDSASPTAASNDYWTSGKDAFASLSKEERKLREIPRYVLDHAPYVHLFSGEDYWPCDLAEHMDHTSPHLNYNKILDLDYDYNLTNLDELNHYEGGGHGKSVYLHSDDNVEERPDWLGGAKNIPNVPARDGDDDGTDVNDSTDLVPSSDGRCGGNTGFTCSGSSFGQCCSIYGWCGSREDFCGIACNAVAGECTDPNGPPREPHLDLRRREWGWTGFESKPVTGGKSSAPAFLVTVPKEDGILDAFWFFFYSFNQGQRVFNVRFGNHVGDWEHTVVRFQHGKPKQIFFSEHSFGQAYTWKAVEKYIPSHDGSGTMMGSWTNATAAKSAKRPVAYSAVGSHAMYGSPGLHPYVLPYGLLHDETDRGPLWDPSLNLHAYTYDVHNQILRASTLNPTSPTSWFHFAGHWGDKYYPLSDPRQYRFAGQYHYVNGPTGPKFKNLGRRQICQGYGECRIRDWLGYDGSEAEWLPAEEDVEEGTLPGGNFTDEAW